ncbi:Uma2 family endonuclease [Gloeocapsa sp. PCC 73106]|uniref:Uma2 family endonuclease n=1 Tax=Gloeocapsa sp. PCC 73106 TaxID=102232 RepID=UPI0002ACDF04|nr:Uma2 family endonuclease [Gloeocapsa sp. PCC 73106]ELR96852.1 hypothetical protein GLO73106DRAFT_00006510 [Gloeocapsa sp. PCC 73106]
MKTLYKWSVEDYHRLIETGILGTKRVELLEGEIIEVSPEQPIHSYTNDMVAEYLRHKLSGLAKIREAHPITLDNSEPEPDIAIVQLRNNNYRDRHPDAESIYWLIEIANKTLQTDLTYKSITYARNGIAEYWVIDLPHSQVWRFTQPLNNLYLQREAIKTGNINPLAFPEVNIEVEKLLVK